MDIIERLTGIPAQQVAETADSMGLTEFGWGLTPEQHDSLRERLSSG